MTGKAEVLGAVRAAFMSEARIDFHNHPIKMDFADGRVTLEGEVACVAAKKLALERAAALPAVIGIVDRLRVAPAQPMGDREIRDHFRDSLAQESAFSECIVRAEVEDRSETMQSPPGKDRGTIDFAVADGVITLNGQVPGLGHKRLAGVLAWWIPGSRDVVNGLAIEPPEDDNYGMVADAVRIALEKDPFVDMGQIRVFVRDWVVTLEGIVPSESERNMAEADAWCVFGVDEVVNHIEVRA